MRRNLCFNFSFSPSMSAFSWRKFQLELKQISHLLRVISSSKWDSLKQHQKKKQLLVGTFFICSLVKIKRNLKKTPFNAQRYMKNLMHWNFHIFFHIIFRGCSESAKFFFSGETCSAWELLSFIFLLKTSRKMLRFPNNSKFEMFCSNLLSHSPALDCVGGTERQ